jgi:hypothetical protein
MRTVLVCLAAFGAPALAHAQQNDQDQPFAAAFAGVVRTWVETRVPDPHAFDGPPASVTSLFSARSFDDSRRISVAAGPRFDRPGPRGPSGGDDGVNWVFGRPIDGFSNGFDQFGNPSVGPVDIRGEARAFVRQKIVTEILSRTALGRGLGVLVDTGSTGPVDGRSRLIPFLSPKVNAREGKAAITLTWKF